MPATERGRGWPTLEILALDLKEAWRFPIPELLAFLYAFFPLIFTPIVRAAVIVGPEEARLLMGMNAASNTMVLITVALVLKNIAYGLANEIRKGLIQTYMTYPIGRGRLLLVKVISGTLVPVAFIALSVAVCTGITFPDLAAEHFEVVLAGLACLLAAPLLLATFMLLAAIVVKRGGASLAVGIALIFAFEIATGMLFVAAGVTGEESLWRTCYLMEPFMAYLSYYEAPGLGPGPNGPEALKLELWECHAYLGSHYAIILALYALAFIYFLRRFEPT